MIYTTKPLMIYRGYNPQHKEGMFVGETWVPTDLFDQVVLMRYAEMDLGGGPSHIGTMIRQATRDHAGNMGCAALLLRAQKKDWLTLATKITRYKVRRKRAGVPLNHRQPWTAFDRAYLEAHPEMSHRDAGKVLKRKATAIMNFRRNYLTKPVIDVVHLND